MYSNVISSAACRDMDLSAAVQEHNLSSSDKWKLLAKTKVAHLTSDEKMLKDELQNIVQRIFQEFTGIQISRKKNTDQEWLLHPHRRGASLRRNQSGEALLTPNFTGDVQHEHNCLILDKTADLAVAEINGLKYHLMHGVCGFAPRDSVVEALRRVSGSMWKGGGCVQWTGTSMGESGRGGEEKKCCERWYKILMDCTSGNSMACNHNCFPHKQRQPAAPVLSTLSPRAHAPEPGPGGTHAHGLHIHAPAPFPVPSPLLPFPHAPWFVTCGHEKRKADMSMAMMCPPSATGPHGVKASQSWWWW
ncbi:hypothetical protein JB92DRAFT_2836990 [Gautieria morchelliformis]|nr:hypothetical protein JB92DRAFT_2836990 [Gautieria morchelliformis]